MRRLILVSLMLLSGVSAVVFAKGPRQFLDVYDFDKGVDTYHSSLNLPDGFVKNSNNVFFDATAPISKRQGYTITWSTKSYSYTGLWTYTDASNTTWQIARSSDQITANNLSGTIVKIATVSVNNVINEANAFGNAYFVDQTQGVYFWNGTSTTYVAGSPKGSIISQFHNRLWVTGLAVPNGNQLYGSKYYDGTTWATGVLDTDPAQYSIGLNDNFDNLTAEYVYLDTLYLFKHYTIFALYGFGQSTFQISQLTQECGCIDGGTIQTFNGGLKFVSLRGVEDFDGYHCKRISDPVKNKVDPAIQTGSFAQQSWVQSSAADFQTGTSSPTNNLSTTISPGDVIVSSFGATDTTNADFSSGTLTNLVTSNNSIILSTNAAEVSNNSFETGDLTNWTATGGGWQAATTISSFVTDCTITPKSGSYFSYGDEASTVGEVSDWTLTVSLIDAISGTSYGSVAVAYAGNSCTYTQRTLTVSASALRHLVYIQGVGNGPSVPGFKSDSFISNGNSITFWSASNHQQHSGVPNLWEKNIAVDLFEGTPKSTITSGNFASRAFDVVFTSNGYLIANANWTVNTTTPTFVLQQGNTAAGPWSDLTTSTNTTLTFSKEFFRYLSTFTITSTDNALSTLDDVTLVARTTGTYYSAVHNVTSMNSWGNFNVDDATNGGNIAYFVRSSTNSFAVTSSTPAWTSQTKNSSIVIATGTYFQMSATFTITSATFTPTLNDFTFQWFTGNNPTPMASTVWDNRYWLSITTNTADSSNDAVLVLSSKGSWSPLDIHAGGFTQTKGVLYHADSTATGNIYQDNQGYADNGAAINAFIVTRDYSFGQLPADDYLYALYPSADNTGSCAMTFNYGTDRGSTTYNLGSPTLSEFASFSAVRLPLPIDSSHQDFGQSFNFTIGTNDASCAWNFYGFQGVYKSRPVN